MPIGPSDKLMQSLYTTQLSSDEENQFQDWVQRNNVKDLNELDSKYDYRGFWKQNPDFTRAPGQHLTDPFKMPGHETFSNESKYATPSDFGGRWFDDIYAPQMATSRQGVNPVQLGNSVRWLTDQLKQRK